MQKDQYTLPKRLFNDSDGLRLGEKLLDARSDDVTKSTYNWSEEAVELKSLYTNGDGNCLLHAASNGLWGIGDDLGSAKLRSAMAFAMKDGHIKKGLREAFRNSRSEMDGMRIEIEVSRPYHISCAPDAKPNQVGT